MPLFSKNLDLGPPLKISSWRKVAIGTWQTVGDPSVYGTLDLDVGPALVYLEKLKKQTDYKLTLTHLVGKAFARTLELHPEINCILRFGKIYPRKTIDIFFQVANDSSGKDLSGTTIRKANLKSLPEIAKELHERVKSIREKGDPSFKKMKKSMGSIPGLLIHPIINIAGFLMYSLNIWSPLLGSPKDPFGSIMITNIGSLGLDMAFAPLVPYSRVPMLIAVGAVKETVIAKNGKIEVAPMMRLCATFDHRIIDGLHASHMCRTLQKIFNHPEEELGGVSAQVLEPSLDSCIDIKDFMTFKTPDQQLENGSLLDS